MKNNNKGILGVGLAVLVASVLVAGLLINKLNFNVSNAVDSCSKNGKQSDCVGACSPKKSDGNQYACAWRSATASCGETSKICNDTAVGVIVDPTSYTNSTDCTASGHHGTWCTGTDIGNRNYAFCIDNTVSLGCDAAAVARGYSIRTGSGDSGASSGGYRCVVGQGKNYAYIAGAICVLNNSVQTVGTGAPPACFCGIIQIDGGVNDGTYQSNCGCGGNNPTDTPTPIITPSPTPTPTHSPSPTPSHSPSPTPSRSPSPTPSCTPSRSPSPTPTRSPSPTPVCTRSPSPSPTGTPLPQCNSFCLTNSQCPTGLTCSWGKCRNPSCTSTSNCICQSPSPSPSPTPTRSPSPTPTNSPSPTPSASPVPNSKLRICKYDDKNNNGVIDNNEETISWIYNYNYQDKDYQVGSAWWNIFDRGCRTVEVPSSQWIRVWENSKDNWSLTNIYSDGNIVGGTDYRYVSYPNTQKTVWFLNHYAVYTTPTLSSTPSPVPSGEPNSCNGTCGSNYNCQGGLFCYQGYCRNPACQSESSCGCPGATSTPRLIASQTAPPVVLGATAPPVLPKTGSNVVEVVLGLTGLVGTGFWLFRKFRLV